MFIASECVCSSDNIAFQYLKESKKSAREYGGWCDRLAEEIVDWAHSKGIKAKAIMFSREEASMFPKGYKLTYPWCYHVVVQVGRKIHDLWFPEVLSRPAYFKKNFGHYDDLKIHTHYEVRT